MDREPNAHSKRLLALCGVVFLLVGLWVSASCGGGSQPTPQPTPTPTVLSLDPALVAAGKAAAQKYRCLDCHSVDGFPMFGPTWKGIYGSQLAFTDGTTAVADDSYLAESIRNPLGKVVLGFDTPMPPQLPVSDEEIGAIIAYIKSLR
ncbi:MAG: cytochrome c [Chloroflexi bacterium]|nr:cytochrome c [Chloroflexota bacterium]